LPDLETVRLPQNKVLYDAGGIIRYAYFIQGGMVSLLSVTARGEAVEVGMIGNEGLAGLPLVFNVDTSPFQAIVQLPCNALRIRSAALKAAFDRGGKLHDLLLRYAHSLLFQLCQSATCNRYHTMEARLCRWLLICQDRTFSDTLPLTQEFVANMIGGPRTSVTAIAVKLQRMKLIRYNRGKVVILDRRLLEAAACECYGVVAEEMNRLLVA
jgi:CRP-like cAMP-binding protein